MSAETSLSILQNTDIPIVSFLACDSGCPVANMDLLALSSLVRTTISSLSHGLSL